MRFGPLGGQAGWPGEVETPAHAMAGHPESPRRGTGSKTIDWTRAKLRGTPSRFLERGSPEDASAFPAPLSIAARLPEPAAFLTMDFSIAKASATFAEEHGVSLCDSRRAACVRKLGKKEHGWPMQAGWERKTKVESEKFPAATWCLPNPDGWAMPADVGENGFAWRLQAGQTAGCSGLPAFWADCERDNTLAAPHLMQPAACPPTPPFLPLVRLPLSLFSTMPFSR